MLILFTISDYQHCLYIAFCLSRVVDCLQGGSPPRDSPTEAEALSSCSAPRCSLLPLWSLPSCPLGVQSVSAGAAAVRASEVTARTEVLQASGVARNEVLFPTQQNRSSHPCQ